MSKIFFVVPVYKVEKYLKRCVESLLAQTYENKEIILVDDGSPDRCPEICDEYAEKYDEVKVIHKENGGLSDARNAGILYVREVAGNEDFISFVDSDDFVHPEFGKKMTDLCNTFGCEIARCGYEKGPNDFFDNKKIEPNIECKSAEDALLGYRLKSLFCDKIFKAKLFCDILFPLGVINEDEFTIYKVVYKAGKVAFTDEELYYYYQNNSGIMADVAKNMKNNPHRFDFLKAYEERIEFFCEKNLPLQVMKTREKICTDIILRYCEQKYLKKADRDIDFVNGTYMKIYRENYKEMIKRHGMPIKRRLMYIIFNIAPITGVVAGKFFKLRK